MSFWFIVFIIIAIAMIIGPIMMMQPSSKDKRLAKLRQEAATNGLKVRLSQYKSNSVAVYSLPVKRPKDYPKWQLLKSSYEHDIHFYNDWQLTEDSDSIPLHQEEELKEFIDQLSSEFVGIEADRSGLGIWWTEKLGGNSITELKILLNKLNVILIKL